MQVTWTLHDDEHVQREETFTVERPISTSEPTGPGGIAAAMAEAFDESVKRVVTRVTGALSQPARRRDAGRLAHHQFMAGRRCCSRG